MKKKLEFCIALAFAVILSISSTACAADGYPAHEPYGEGVGVMPGRVVWSYEPDSVDWDGSGYWWEPDNFNEAVMRNMVSDSIAALGGASTAADGWRALFENRNERNGESGGYKAGEKIAIKANINGSAVMDDDTSGETSMSYTNPVLLKALLTSLVEDAGVTPSDITVYDVSRLFPDYMEKMCTEGILSGVNFVNRDNGVADESAPIVWSHEFSGAVNYLPTCVTEAKYMINLANLKGHSYGITLCGKNHFGSFINGNAMRPPEGANLHGWLTRNEMGIYSPLVDLMANKHLGGKTVLYMLDAIICAPSEGASITLNNSKWRQEPFNGDFTSSIFVSQDPVAIDSVGADFIINEPAVTENNYAARDVTNENYLHEAGLVKNASSGTVYTDSFGTTVTNLGVHEHWNNPTDKQYSRNLGKDEGIELVMAKPSASGNVTAEYDEESGDVTVNNAPENSTLIIAFYKNNVLSDVKLHRGSGTFTANIRNGAEDADKAKIFLWDMKTIRPLSEAKEIITEAETKMNVQVGDAIFTATLEDNAAAREFVAMMKEAPVTINMSDYSGFEKVGPLGRSLTESNSQMTTVPGDIVLYNGDQIVMFYGSNSWSYTKLGHIDDLTGWESALGSGDITAVFSIGK